MRKLVPYILLLFGVVFCTQAKESNVPVQKSASFTAILLSFHQSKPDIVQKGEIIISDIGIKQISIPVENGNQNIVDTIFNVKQKKSYMLNRSNHTYFEVPVQKDNDEKVLPGGLFTNQPCQDYKRSKKVRKKHYSGRSITEWRCESQNHYVTQYYDDLLRTVIREEHQDGNVEELRDIVIKKIPGKTYEIPEGYRKISMQEFFTGVPKFEKYQETGTEGDFKLEENKDKLQKYGNNK